MRRKPQLGAQKMHILEFSNKVNSEIIFESVGSGFECISLFLIYEFHWMISSNDHIDYGIILRYQAMKSIS